MLLPLVCDKSGMASCFKKIVASINRKSLVSTKMNISMKTALVCTAGKKKKQKKSRKKTHKLSREIFSFEMLL